MSRLLSTMILAAGGMLAFALIGAVNARPATSEA